jgi:hypothetical protein
MKGSVQQAVVGSMRWSTAVPTLPAAGAGHSTETPSGPHSSVLPLPHPNKQTLYAATSNCLHPSFGRCLDPNKALTFHVAPPLHVLPPWMAVPSNHLLVQSGSQKPSFWTGRACTQAGKGSAWLSFFPSQPSSQFCLGALIQVTHRGQVSSTRASQECMADPAPKSSCSRLVVTVCRAGDLEFHAERLRSC